MWSRRQFLARTLGVSAAGLLGATPARTTGRPALKLAAFRFDVTPPVGHPLCGGWIPAAVGVDDPLQGLGLLLTGAEQPIVLCALDWTGLLNDAHRRWRETLAEAAGTTPDRVAVHCVHQHNAPFVCLEAERIVSAEADLPHVVLTDFFERCLERAARAVAAAKRELRPVTHLATGQARVEGVASNRRILGPDGRVADWRGSSSKNPRHWELPEGLIDPWLRTVAFYDGKTRVAACHYYACHPMSYYGDGRVSSDFAGLARARRQAEQPDCAHLYFTGCAGNVAAGKYNDGSPRARRDLTDRLYTALVASERDLRPERITRMAWQTREAHLRPRATVTAAELQAEVRNPGRTVAERIRAAMRLAFWRRCQRREAIVLTTLHINRTSLLHLPGECFVEYQLRAQALAPERVVAVAAYGDGGPWYIPTAEAYPQGGYEVSVAFSEPDTDEILSRAMRGLLGGAA